MTVTKWLIAILLFGTMSAYGQTGESELHQPAQWKSRARYAMQLGDWYTAIDYYERYCNYRPEKVKDQYQLAHLYRRTRNYKKAAATYQKAYELKPDRYTDALLYKGLMLMQTGAYDEAEKALQDYKKKGRSSITKEQRKQLRHALESLELIPQWMDSTLNVAFTHPGSGVNQPHIEFAPLPINDSTLVFGSLRTDELPTIDLTDEAGEELPMRKFYRAHKEAEVWVNDGEWDHPANRGDENTGNGAFSPDGKRFYFSRCKEDVRNKMICKIYVSKKLQNGWAKPKPIEAVNHESYTASMPAVGVDPKNGEDVLYFVSDRPGGKGGMDIWFSYYHARSQTWKEPKNCGSKVNSVGDEISPTYHPQTKTLYFASDSWPGLGGLDIFKATGEMRKFLPAANIGVPLNTSADELYYVLNEDRTSGYLVSNREGGISLRHSTCCDDIYHFEFKAPVIINVVGKVLNLESGSEDNFFESTNGVSPSESSEALVDAKVNLAMILPENGDTLLIESFDSNDEGQYQFQLEPGFDYTITVEKDDYITRTVPVSTLGQSQSIDLELLPVGMLKLSRNPVRLPQISYKTNSAELTREAKAMLDSTLLIMLVENPALKVEIGAHSDSRGSSDYNENLSKRRAGNVVSYLVSKDIDRVRLSAKGYGESDLLQNDVDADGKFIESAGELNRRTEFRVINWE